MKDEKVKVKGSTHLTYTGWLVGLEHLKIETRLIDEMFPSVMGESIGRGRSGGPVWSNLFITNQ